MLVGHAKPSCLTNSLGGGRETCGQSWGTKTRTMFRKPPGSTRTTGALSSKACRPIIPIVALRHDTKRKVHSNGGKNGNPETELDGDGTEGSPVTLLTRGSGTGRRPNNCTGSPFRSVRCQQPRHQALRSEDFLLVLAVYKEHGGVRL